MCLMSFPVHVTGGRLEKNCVKKFTLSCLLQMTSMGCINDFGSDKSQLDGIACALRSLYWEQDLHKQHVWVEGSADSSVGQCPIRTEKVPENSEQLFSEDITVPYATDLSVSLLSSGNQLCGKVDKFYIGISKCSFLILKTSSFTNSNI